MRRAMSAAFKERAATMTKTFSYAEFGAMFVDLNDIITWGIEGDGNPTFEIADSAVADRLVERHRVDPAEAREVTKWFLGRLESGGARRISSLAAS
jgi:hypothetical protein